MGRRRHRLVSTGPGRVGSCGGFPDQCFQLGERHFDGVEVGRVGWQENQVVALGAQKFDGARRLVRRQVVGDDDLAGPQCWGELALDVSIEAVAIHRNV